MFVLIMAIGALVAGVGLGARWVAWIVTGAIALVSGVGGITVTSPFDLIVSFFMAVLGFVMGAQWRRRTRRWASLPGSDGGGESGGAGGGAD